MSGWNINQPVGITLRSASTYSKVVLQGRRLVRRIIQVLTGIKRGQYVRLEAEIYSFTTVARFLDKWNGVETLPELKQFTTYLTHQTSGAVQ